MKHQYIERYTNRVWTEKLFADPWVRLIYSKAEENPGLLLRMLTSGWFSRALASLLYDSRLGSPFNRNRHFFDSTHVDLTECADEPGRWKTAREVFERKIRYWECRPMCREPSAVVSPADARILVGSLLRRSSIFIKGKFFELDELLGRKKKFVHAFRDGDFAVLRLTPEKYHYNHTPVAGEVVDIYEVQGMYHSCNPGAIVGTAASLSKNRRVVTIIDTDVYRGSRVGLVAMIEIVALMIGDVVQCYSTRRYDSPAPVGKGMFLEKGVPKSRYRPGSSTDVLLFERERIDFARDILFNMHRPGIESRYSEGFGRPLVETDIRVRSLIASGKNASAANVSCLDEGEKERWKMSCSSCFWLS